MPEKTQENPIEVFIIRLAQEDIRDRENFLKLQRKISKRFGLPFFQKSELIAAYQKLVNNGALKANKKLEKLFTMKAVRSLSGIAVVSVLTKPYACPGKCLYCPSAKNVPKSYLANEPAVMRAIACDYDPYKQTTARLNSLAATGHAIGKINIRVIGGTWSYYPRQYQTWFIKRVFAACNDFQNDKYQIPPVSASGETEVGSIKQKISNHRALADLQRANEMAKCRIVEISIETRQDFIDKKEIKRLRQLGATKVELGVQSIYDDVLLLNRRGHSNGATIEATKLLRDAGFKVSYQMMANLLGSDLKKDLEMFKRIFASGDYQPDYLKIYPLALVRSTPIYSRYLKKKFNPYSREELIDLIKKIKLSVPRYCRVERVIRDIPATEIIAGGAKISNLRQIILDEMRQEDLACRCIRCREIHGDYNDTAMPMMFREDYQAGNGQEIFLSLESHDRSVLYSLLRLRIPSQHFKQKKHFLQVLNNSSIIREVHTYGLHLPVGTKNRYAAQHQGLGKKLIKEAEKITKKEYGLSKIAAISGVGARQYFRKLGYQLRDTYMLKEL